MSVIVVFRSKGTVVVAGDIGLGPVDGQMAALDHVIDGLGDVGGVIAGALDVLGDEQQMRAQPDGARIFHHVGQKLAEQAVVDLVDLAVVAPHRFGAFGIAVGIGIQHQLELA